MQKASTFKKLLLIGASCMTLLNAAPVMAKTIVTWRGTGIHQGMPLAEDGRPKFMLEYIDLLNNSITYDYVDDGMMEGEPWLIGVTWFDSEEDLQDTSLMEGISDFWQIGQAVLGASMDDAEREELRGGVTRYTFPMLNYYLENDDPTGKWAYFLRFLGGENIVYWNAQVDYTQCLIEYRDLRWGEEGELLTKGGCRGSYDEFGNVTYNLEYRIGPEEPEVEPGAGVGSGAEVEPGMGGGEVEPIAGSEVGSGNAVEILRRERGGTEVVEVASVMGENSRVEEEVKENPKEEESKAQEGEIEVPELNGGEEQKGKVQWWMIVVMGALVAGIGAWWIILAFKRRRDDEEKDDKEA